MSLFLPPHGNRKLPKSPPKTSQNNPHLFPSNKNQLPNTSKSGKIPQDCPFKDGFQKTKAEKSNTMGCKITSIKSLFRHKRYRKVEKTTKEKKNVKIWLFLEGLWRFREGTLDKKWEVWRRGRQRGKQRRCKYERCTRTIRGWEGRD